MDDSRVTEAELISSSAEQRQRCEQVGEQAASDNREQQPVSDDGKLPASDDDRKQKPADGVREQLASDDRKPAADPEFQHKDHPHRGEQQEGQKEAVSDPAGSPTFHTAYRLRHFRACYAYVAHRLFTTTVPQERRRRSQATAVAVVGIAMAITIAALAIFLGFPKAGSAARYVCETSSDDGSLSPSQRSYVCVFNSLLLTDPLMPNGTNGSYSGLDQAASELLLARENLYLGEALLLKTEDGLASFRRRGDLAKVSEELNAAHKAVMRRVRELADEIHDTDEETGRVSNSVQTAARDALLNVYRGARAITFSPESREKVFAHLRNAAVINEQAADMLGQLSERYSQLSRKAYSLQADSINWLLDARDLGGRIQADRDSIRSQTKLAAKNNPRVTTTKTKSPPPPKRKEFLFESSYHSALKAYQEAERPREEYQQLLLKMEEQGRMTSYLDDGAEVMMNVGGALDHVMALLRQVEDYYRHRAHFYRNVVRDLKELADEDDGSVNWLRMVREGFGAVLAVKAKELLSRADTSFDRYISFQAAVHAERVERKQQVFRQLEQKPHKKP